MYTSTVWALRAKVNLEVIETEPDKVFYQIVLCIISKITFKTDPIIESNNRYRRIAEKLYKTSTIMKSWQQENFLTTLYLS